MKIVLGVLALACAMGAILSVRAGKAPNLYRGNLNWLTLRESEPIYFWVTVAILTAFAAIFGWGAVSA